MKIKVKKEMNLLELIEYIKKNEIADKVFFDKKGKGKVVVGDDRHLYMTDLNLTDTFIVEVEEVITEETVIPLLLEVYEYEGELVFLPQKRSTIKSLLKQSDLEENITTKTLYLINDDGTLTLIWKDGELVG
ncbi:hypothetical protein JL972_08900 [Staphylococcus pseudintermedius]|uniref:hypothetical protein n=1 Tax=Staphylococcus pseudintermedius TaxID=283734 RepID=UPI0019EF4646|nr:hypothetical protein [Staphylococcus pseudintermedius]EGQ3563729.1 hypothetical protein [Staphylococcus pseudintermedius]EHT8052336.1 hypothetical protein [Staphylococcus pseudintermedius]EIE3602099.1 hypothetical protein [Staphylococcus pseudintermedius]EKO0722509.1 hypothetical protein [Staphylococcus pseudintermedius]ELH4343123.1 hypothetical protein [Staphylococcus pseudintermedius]